MVLNFDTEIEILLHDQNKIVTYKELSNRFNLTPFEARKKLENYVSNKREKENEKSNFYVTYLINGEDKTSKIKRLELVNENDLDKCSKEMKILSKQVYSIQNNIIEDFNLIYTSDLDVSTNSERKLNLNVISTQVDRKEIPILEDKSVVKSNLDSLKSTRESTGSDTTKDQSNTNSNNAPKTNILVDSLKTNINKEESDTVINKKDDTHQISETVNKKLKIKEEKKEEEPTKPILKPTAKKNEPAKKTTNQSITSFFKKA